MSLLNDVDVVQLRNLKSTQTTVLSNDAFLEKNEHKNGCFVTHFTTQGRTVRQP